MTSLRAVTRPPRIRSFGVVGIGEWGYHIAGSTIYDQRKNCTGATLTLSARREGDNYVVRNSNSDISQQVYPSKGFTPEDIEAAMRTEAIKIRGKHAQVRESFGLLYRIKRRFRRKHPNHTRGQLVRELLRYHIPPEKLAGVLQ